MSWLSKTLKKVKIGNVAKAVSKAQGALTKATKFLPAPIGAIAEGGVGLLAGAGKSLAKKEKTAKAKKGAGGGFISRIPKTRANMRLLKQTAQNVATLKKRAK